MTEAQKLESKGYAEGLANVAEQTIAAIALAKNRGSAGELTSDDFAIAAEGSLLWRAWADAGIVLASTRTLASSASPVDAVGVEDLVEKLRETVLGDHDRGCHGREYVCSCGYDNRIEKAALRAITIFTRPKPHSQVEKATRPHKFTGDGPGVIGADNCQICDRWFWEHDVAPPAKETIEEFVPSQRLEALIGAGTPTSSETHDMAVELILRRRAASVETPETSKAAQEGTLYPRDMGPETDANYAEDPRIAKAAHRIDLITQAELAEIFGDTMPIEAVTLLWECPLDWTIDRLRSELRALANVPRMNANRSAAEGLQEIIELSRNLRSGGPDVMDLQGLSDGLERAVEIAADILATARVEELPPVPHQPAEDTTSTSAAPQTSRSQDDLQDDTERALPFRVDVSPPPASHDYAELASSRQAELINRLQAAIEGECAGLAIDEDQAKTILEYIGYLSPAVGAEEPNAAGGDLSKRLNDLRLRAFKTNSPFARAAYFTSLSHAFQSNELVPALPTPVEPSTQKPEKRYCQCKSLTNPCIVCGLPKFIDREWLKRKIEEDVEEGEIGAGFEIFPLPEETPTSTQKPVAWQCAARKQGTAGGNEPADCDWPMCGCDPYADKVIAALEELGALASLPQAGERGSAKAETGAVAQLGGAPDDLRNLIKVVFADMPIERMGDVCKEVIARRDPALAPAAHPVAPAEGEIATKLAAIRSSAPNPTSQRALEDLCEQLSAKLAEVERNWHTAIAMARLNGERVNTAESSAADLRRKLEEARKALEPFGRENDLPANLPDSTNLNIIFAGHYVAYATFGDFRRARALTSGAEQ